MKRSAALLAAFLLCTALAAQTLPELFTKSKEQVKAGSWQDALKTF